MCLCAERSALGVPSVLDSSPEMLLHVDDLSQPICLREFHQCTEFPVLMMRFRHCLCLNSPFESIGQSFMDMQFPNGQLRYVAGDGFTARGFLPLGGSGIVQAHGKFPGEKRLSFSYKVSTLPHPSQNVSAFSAHITTESQKPRHDLSRCSAERQRRQRHPDRPVAGQVPLAGASPGALLEEVRPHAAASAAAQASSLTCKLQHLSLSCQIMLHLILPECGSD